MRVNGITIVKGCRPSRHNDIELPDYSDVPECDTDGQSLFAFDEPEEPEPTQADPGSEDKMLVLSERYEHGMPLFVNGDKNIFPGWVYDEID